MPEIIEYREVLRRMLAQGYVSLYHNSGAFGFAKEARPQAAGWIGPADPTLRPEAAQIAQRIAAPYEQNLAKLVARVWHDHLAGALWMMPMSHWAYELDFASRRWMPALLGEIGIDPAPLEKRNDGAAIAFAGTEGEMLERFACGLLTNLSGSDFAIAFPGRSALATLHHHKQIWWTTTDVSVKSVILSIVAKDLDSRRGQDPSGAPSGR